MSTYGQYCAVARSLELLGDRWTLLIVREVLMGARRFSAIQRGVPRISRTVLSDRLRRLVDGGVLERGDGYTLTPAGHELCEVVQGLGRWGMRWLDRDLAPELLDPDFLLHDMERRTADLPVGPVLVRLVFSDARLSRPSYLRVEDGTLHACPRNPGFDVDLTISTDLQTLTSWWVGTHSWEQARRGMRLEGPRALQQGFPGWFRRYALADVGPATR